MTPPLKPEQIKALNQNADVLLGPDWGKRDLAKAMQVNVCTVHRVLQGKGKPESRSKLASVLATRRSAHFTFEDLIDEHFDVRDVLRQREKHNEA